MSSRIVSSVLVAVWAVCGGIAPSAASAQDKSPMEAAYGNRDWKQAAEFARARTQEQPNDADAWYVLGNSLTQMSEFDGALAAFDAFAKVPGYAGYGRFAAASVYVKKGDVDSAIRMLDEAAAGGFSSASELGIDRNFDAIRGDARYLDVLKKIEDNARVAQARGDRLMFSTETDRKSARLVLYGGLDTLRVVIDHGMVPWRDGYAKALEDPELEGRRWRMGANDWTTLDTNVGLSLGDLDVPAGEYGLTLRREDKRVLLELHDMKDMRARRVDPYYCQALEVPAFVTELDVETLDEPAKDLAISIAPSKPNDGHVCELRIDFGPHRLTTPLVLQEK
ncbi:MAG: DUF2911 domain-containing protein [Planctomycetes bacterium]|nr:DUF2911 domain-containing protein [Planctomycetota bacterium]MCC7171682.1 DUF2911 domain-containing protein [Planctomycetota bacterium]